MCSQPDRDEMEEILNRLRKKEKTIDFFVRRIVQDHEVEEVKQELWKELWRNIRDIPANPIARTSWLRKFVRNVSLAWLRKEIRQQGGGASPIGQGGKRLHRVQPEEHEWEVEAALASQAGLTEHPRDQETLIEKDQEQWRWSVLRKAISSLPTDLREAYVQVKLRGRLGTEVAADLGISRPDLIRRIRKADDLIARHLCFGAIDCVVLDQHGDRLSAIVRLRARDGSASIRTEHTTLRDPARFDGLVPGDYVIEVTSPRYIDFEQPLVVAIGLARVELMLTLKTAQPCSTGGPYA